MSCVRFAVYEFTCDVCGRISDELVPGVADLKNGNGSVWARDELRADGWLMGRFKPLNGPRDLCPACVKARGEA